MAGYQRKHAMTLRSRAERTPGSLIGIERWPIPPGSSPSRQPLGAVVHFMIPEDPD
jgi:hypothetical protein